MQRAQERWSAGKRNARTPDSRGLQRIVAKAVELSAFDRDEPTTLPERRDEPIGEQRLEHHRAGIEAFQRPGSFKGLPNALAESLRVGIGHAGQISG
jgi:hypothetical protein